MRRNPTAFEWRLANWNKFVEKRMANHSEVEAQKAKREPKKNIYEMKLDDDTYPFNAEEQESRCKFFNTRFSDIGPRKRSADRWPEEN